MEFDRDKLIEQLYADNLLFKAQIKLLRGMIIALASTNGRTDIGKTLIDFYDSNILTYYEDQILLSPMKDEHLQKQAEDFLKQMKEGL